jgi:hypothetical protein
MFEDVVLHEEHFLREHRFNLLNALRQQIGRALAPSEAALIHYAKHCGVCFRVNCALVPCKDCNSVFFCKDHKDLPNEEAESCHPCRILCTSRICEHITAKSDGPTLLYDQMYVLRELRYAPFGPTSSQIPVQVSEGTGWPQYFHRRGHLKHVMQQYKPDMPEGSADELTQEIAQYTATPGLVFETEQLSFVLTLVFLLERMPSLDLSTATSLNVHIIKDRSAQAYVCGMKWEEVFNLLPQLEVLKIAFIGREVGGQESKTDSFTAPLNCDALTNANCRLEITRSTHTYHDFANEFVENKPDLVISFQAVIHDYKDLFTPVLRKLAELRVPCAFTAYKAWECAQDATIAVECGLELTMQPSSNPYRSLRKMCDPLNLQSLYSSNNCIFACGPSPLEGDVLEFAAGSLTSKEDQRPIAISILPTRKVVPGAEVLMCAICFSEVEEGSEVKSLPCDHSFHDYCISSWLNRGNDTCPLCKHVVVLPADVK